ncbi:hypothetical protein [Streptomyces sp. H51]|uniref:hypothetical protein n=1 Tax=Streptomyces sp. H51 TaxID=3111770 RepID=UPI002D79631F|nr:hypothetical protein [Streptomyces sp. H51]
MTPVAPARTTSASAALDAAEATGAEVIEPDRGGAVAVVLAPLRPGAGQDVRFDNPGAFAAAVAARR